MFCSITMSGPQEGDMIASTRYHLPTDTLQYPRAFQAVEETFFPKQMPWNLSKIMLNSWTEDPTCHSAVIPRATQPRY